MKNILKGIDTQEAISLLVNSLTDYREATFVRFELQRLSILQQNEFLIMLASDRELDQGLGFFNPSFRKHEGSS